VCQFRSWSEGKEEEIRRRKRKEKLPIEGGKKRNFKKEKKK